MRRRPVQIEDAIQRTIAGLHPDTKKKVRAAIDAIGEDPSEGDPLEQELNGFRKIVIGSWRIVYREEGRVIRVYAVGRRATVYSELIDRLRQRIEERRGPYRRRRAARARSAPRAARARPGSR